MSEYTKNKHEPLDKQDVEEAVERAIKQVLLSMGINARSPRDIIEIQRDIQYLRNARLGSEKVTVWARRSLVGTFCSGIIYLIITGVRQVL